MAEGSIDEAATVARLRAHTPGVANVIHFNNAGSSLPAAPVIEAQVEFTRREGLFGGYETAEALGDRATQAYRDLSHVLNAAPERIGFCQSATEAWRRVLYALPLKAGSRLVYDESIYGGNLLALLDGRDRYGWELVPVAIDPDSGMIDPAELAEAVSTGADLVALTHMAAQNGAVNDIGRLAATAAEAGAFSLIDSCQTLGHVPIDFDALGVDGLIFTGRKYLRAPRGTGGFVLSPRAARTLRPLGPDIRGATVGERSAWTLEEGAIGFEYWERNWAVHCGLTAAIEYLAGLNRDWAWQRVQYLAAVLTETLRGMAAVKVRRLSGECGGIVVFDVPGKDLRAVRDYLRSHGANVMYAGPQNAPLQMTRHAEHGWVRASVHYYNTEEEIGQFAALLSRCVAEI